VLCVKLFIIFVLGFPTEIHRDFVATAFTVNIRRNKELELADKKKWIRIRNFRPVFNEL